MTKRWFRSWRRQEAHMVPLTKEGEKRAEERAKDFYKTYKVAMRDAANLLENMHRENKGDHNFYLFASRELRKISEEGYND